MTLEGRDAEGNLDASASVRATPLDSYVALSMVASGNEIVEVAVTGGVNVTGIENFRVGTATTHPAELLGNLVEIVDESQLVQGVDNALDAKLGVISAALTGAYENNKAGICNALDALVIYVEAEWAGDRLTDEPAQFLVNAADKVIALLCPGTCQ